VGKPSPWDGETEADFKTWDEKLVMFMSTVFDKDWRKVFKKLSKIRVLTKVSEGLFLGTVFLSCWQAVGELSASQRHNWQTVVFNVVMVRVSFGERERERVRER
jgi:hypothetical protein